MHASTWAGVKLVFRKEAVSALRFRAAWAAMFMFALTTLACVSLALSGARLAAPLAAALLWVILFFASVAGADRVFAEEDTSGTLLALRVYGGAQAVLLGKMLYTFVLLLALGVFTVPLFLVFLDMTVASPLLLALACVLGLAGVAAAGTLIAALTVGAAAHSGLFAVLLLPVILPVFLPAISLTAAAFGPGEASLAYLGGLVLYDGILAVGASVLFDYLWYEE